MTVGNSRIAGTKIKTIEELFNKLSIDHFDTEVSFHGKVSEYFIQKLNDGTFNCQRVTDWNADQLDKIITVKPVTVLKRYKEVYCNA